MTEIDADVAILGAGFGGSLTALVLKAIGLRPLLVERCAHPRFALGESSTPIADLVLGEIARRFDLPQLLPLTHYGDWKRVYPQINCGLKRGFSYFQHQRGRPFEACDDHRHELLVAASTRDEDSDTHWHRADVDHYFVREAQKAGIPYFERTEITALQAPGSSLPERWQIEARQGDQPLRIAAKFIVDASGEGGVLARHLGISTEAKEMATNSRAVYAHFTGVRRWEDILRSRGARLDDYPFHADHAALHHILDGGWMYVLRFDDGVTSAGFALDTRHHPPDQSLSPAEEWSRLMEQYPSLAEQFANAIPVAPEGGIRRSGRLQRFAARMVGANWAMLPATAGIVDPLHSGGNAHTLCGIQRLAGILERSWGRPELQDALADYGRTLAAELKMVDRLVHGCYAAFGCFDLMAAYSMCYFASATFSEMRRRQGRAAADAFLLSTDPALQTAVGTAYARLLETVSRGSPQRDDIHGYQVESARLLSPFNLAGLCDPAKRNMYPFTGHDCL